MNPADEIDNDSSSNNSVLIGICELLGASVFIITFIVGWVASIQPVKVPSSTFFRDIVFQAAATLLLALNFWLGFVNINKD